MKGKKISTYNCHLYMFVYTENSAIHFSNFMDFTKNYIFLYMYQQMESGKHLFYNCLTHV